MDNTKYFTAELIYNRVSTKYKDKVKQFNLRNFIEWCATVELEYMGSFEQFKNCNGYEIEVKNNRAKLPCNIYRLVDVMDGDERIYNYRNNGVYLFFDNKNYGDGKKITINYSGIPIDEKTKMPLLLRGHEIACEYFCIHSMYEADYMEGKVADRFMERIAKRFDDAVDAARSSHRHVPADEAHKMIAAMANIIPNPNRIPTKDHVK